GIRACRSPGCGSLALGFTASSSDKCAEQRPEAAAVRIQALAAMRAPLRETAPSQCPQTIRRKGRTAATLVAAAKPLRDDSRRSDDGRPPPSESRPAKNSSPAPLIAATHSPNARAHRKTPRCGSTPVRKQALQISSRETWLEHKPLQAGI